MDKQKVMHSYNKILFHNEKKQTTNIHNKSNECQNHYVECKMPDIRV